MKNLNYFALALCGLALLGCGDKTGPAQIANKNPGLQTLDKPERLITGPPNRKAFASRPDLVKAAYETKDDVKILAALERELKGNPLQHEYRLQQAQTLERMGRKVEARQAYKRVLWPPEGSGSSLMGDMTVVERYLTLCDATRDSQGVADALARADEVLARSPNNLPAKKLTTVSEFRAAMIYQAYREARNREQYAEAMVLIKKAIAQDGTVALYQIRYAEELDHAAHELATLQEDSQPAIVKWRETLGVLTQAKKASLHTPSDDDRIESMVYDVTNLIEMAKHGVFKNAALQRKKIGGKVYTVTSDTGPRSVIVKDPAPK